jgi:hypothetical protein
MKKILFLSLALALGSENNVNATLWDRGGGLIYDVCRNIILLQDANYIWL